MKIRTTVAAAAAAAIVGHGGIRASCRRQCEHDHSHPEVHR